MKLGDAKILISDDSILARKQLKDMLSSLGAVNIFEAANGQEAVDLYKEHIPDITFLDIITPLKDGNAVIAEIQKINPQADIVIVSSIGTQSQLMRAIQLGAKDFVQKPLNAYQIEFILDTRFERGLKCTHNFFGNYLLSKRAVTTEQLAQAIEEQHIRHIKLGILAIDAGLMTTEQVDSILLRQAHENRNFGELAVEEGYLTKEQIESLLNEQIPVYLLIGERLVENGVLTESELEQYIVSYQEENTLSQIGESDTLQEELQTLFHNLFILTDDNIPDYFFQYMTLLFNNLVRLIGDDFMTLNPSLVSEYVTSHCSAQIINGELSMTSYLELEDDAAAIAFASRYAGSEFTEYDAYVRAAMDDFLNLQNGLFNVNISNEKSIELYLNPVTDLENTLISSTSDIILLPVIYPFGTLNFLFKI